VTGNNKVWKKFTFAPVTTDKIRISTTASLDGHSRIVEVEAWGLASTGSISSVHWLVTDHLGTPRMVIDQTGSMANVKRHDYLPFGEELFAGTGGRTVAQGYSAADGVRQQFTQKERDIETGLDYFGARYYSSVQGRFTSIDPENAGAALWQPQSWSGYTYALNNPLRFIDPDGLRWAQIVVDGGIAYRWFDDNDKDDNGQTEYDRALANGYSAVTFDESKPFSYTNGIFAPGEVLTTVTLDPRGPSSSTISQHQVGFVEWLVVVTYLYDHDYQDPRQNYAVGAWAFDQLLSSIVGRETTGSPNLPTIPSAATGVKLTPSELKKLGGLSNRAEEKVADVIRSRGGNASNVRQAGPWAQKTLAETAKAATGGDKTAETAIKIAKEAKRLGQKN
jgi:RHS repeat-associated protein